METGIKVKVTKDEQSIEYIVVVKGDSNGDGEYLLASDVNEDGKVDLLDILQINKFRLGKIEEL